MLVDVLVMGFPVDLIERARLEERSGLTLPEPLPGQSRGRCAFCRGEVWVGINSHKALAAGASMACPGCCAERRIPVAGILASLEDQNAC